MRRGGRGLTATRRLVCLDMYAPPLPACLPADIAIAGGIEHLTKDPLDWQVGAVLCCAALRCVALRVVAPCRLGWLAGCCAALRCGVLCKS